MNVQSAEPEERQSDDHEKEQEGESSSDIGDDSEDQQGELKVLDVEDLSLKSEEEATSLVLSDDAESNEKKMRMQLFC